MNQSPRRPNPVRLVDVAEHAGVSLATASRALSTPELVREATLQRVEQAARSLGYVPHGAARALASQRTRTIGAVFPPVDNPIFATGTHALSETLTAAGYTLLLATHDYNDSSEIAAVRRLIERGVDGMVLVGLQHHADVFELLDQSSTPYELTWLSDAGSAHYNVGVDHREASARMTRHLVSLGHREFAIIAGMIDSNDRARERLRGAREALEQAGIVLPDARVVAAPFAVEAGKAALMQLVQQAPGFSALICGNDVQAIGAIQQCRVLGMPVPGELSVVGFDDIDMAEAVTPALSTVKLPSDDIGRMAGQRLLSRLSGESVPLSQTLTTTLIFRDTVSAPGPARGG